MEWMERMKKEGVVACYRVVARRRLGIRLVADGIRQRGEGSRMELARTDNGPTCPPPSEWARTATHCNGGIDVSTVDGDR